MERPIVNLDELQFESWIKDFPITERPPPQFDARKAAVGSRIGARKLGYDVTAIAPGKRAFPRHNHRVNEEAFFVLEGRGEMLLGAGRLPPDGKPQLLRCFYPRDQQVGYWTGE
jgi:oxalate decarboxylase/phosphoglucose isomerase-like protein (cupin superfamily)